MVASNHIAARSRRKWAFPLKLGWLAGPPTVLIVVLACLTGDAGAAGAGGWDHVGSGATAGTPSLNGSVFALNASRPGTLYVGGNFTAAGGVAGADRIASWNGTAWSPVSSPTSQIANGAVDAIAYDPVTGSLFAGGTFTDAGGDANADFIAKWDGTRWAPFCAPITGNVNALQIAGRKLYVGGSFQDGAGLAAADYLVACDLDTGAASATADTAAHAFTGAVYTLTADTNGTLYAGGGFINQGGDAAADHVAYLDASGVGWHALGRGAGTCGCAVDDFVRSLTAVGTDVYVGTDAVDVAGIPQADHVARWNGSAWSATGANAAGTDGWFPTSAFVYGMTNDGTNVYATGSFQNADGDATADAVARFDGSAWHPIGSDGAGNGPWSGNGLALAQFGQRLYAGGNFTSAGGDTLAHGLAVTSKPGAAPPPAPVLGKEVDVKLVSGVVLVKAPGGGQAFVPLTEASQLPVGTEVDARAGVLRIVTATPAGPKTQSGTFSGGVFAVQQSGRRRDRGLTTLSLVNHAFPGAPSYAACAASTRGPATVAAKKGSHGVVQHLKAKVAGRFRTRGRYSAATVRGTIWDVADRCDGSLTRVTRGTVVVTDFVRHRSVVVHAGRSYLASA